jgi:Methyltransferase domain
MSTADDEATRWLDPARMFSRGYPEGVTSALRELPELRAMVREEIRVLAPRSALEVGPGDAPLIGELAACCYLDVARHFLLPHAGQAVCADAAALPFGDTAFELALAGDVLAHLSPERRLAAIGELARVARVVVLVNPEPQTAGLPDRRAPIGPLLHRLEELGFTTQTQRFLAWMPDSFYFQRDGEYVIALVTARRR